MAFIFRIRDGALEVILKIYVWLKYGLEMNYNIKNSRKIYNVFGNFFQNGSYFIHLVVLSILTQELSHFDLK